MIYRPTLTIYLGINTQHLLGFTGTKMKRTPHKLLRLTSFLGLFAASIASPAVMAATVDEDISLETLLEMDITELMDIEINLVSRSNERYFTTAAATYVITQEDIKRSGLRSIPELLRLVPGFHVGHIDANKWGISSRKPASQFTSDMLVLMDGRTLFTPLFNGTYWNVQDTFIEDIDRIEIIRGPGSAAWGANAINGIINIITKSAQDTQNTYLYAAAGEGEMRSELGFRQGFNIDDKTYGRFYAKKRHKDHGEYLDATNSNNTFGFPVGEEAHDDGQYAQLGFRIDQLRNGSELTIQGDVYDGSLGDIRKGSAAGTISPSVADTNSIDVSGFNLIFNWKNKITDNQSLSTTAYIDMTDRQDEAFNDHREVADIDIQHDITWGQQHTSWGLSYRYHRDNTSNSNSSSIARPRLNLYPTSKTDHLAELFIQNKSELIADKLFLTIGSKFEENDYSGSEHQPSARLSYTPDKQQTFWLATSRSVATPTRGGDLYLDYNDLAPCIFPVDPVLGCIIDITSTVSISYTKELGYRNIINDRHIIDIALYYQTLNNSDTHNSGIEINTRHELTKNWKLEYWFAQQYSYTESTGDKVYNKLLQTPTMHLRSYYNISKNLQFDLLAYYVADKLNKAGSSLLAQSYTRLDAHVNWQYDKNIDIDFSVTNLTDDVHSEEREDTSRVNTGVNRGYFVKLNYKF